MKLPKDVLDYFRKQGKIGGTKRTSALSPERRKEIAKIAADARWARVKEISTQAANPKKRSRSKEGQ